MSVTKRNNAVSVISNGATVKKPEIAGVSYAGNLGIPAAVGQPSAVGLTGGEYTGNIERYYGDGNSLAGGGSLTVSPANGNGLTGGLYGSFLGSGAGSSPVGSLTPATSLAGSALAGKNLTGGLYGQNLDRYFDSNFAGKVGAGTVGGASRGGVTNEGFIVGGNTGNLEKFPTIGSGNGNVNPQLPSSGVQSGLSGSVENVTHDALKRLQDQLKQQNASPSTGTQKNTGAAAGTDTPSTSAGNSANAEQTPPSVSTPPTSSNEAENSESMTYEQYIEEAKKGYQAQLEATKKQAEQTRQRAVVDAQSSYMQNLASYGANAEQMAAAGMRGGGYSDYLNAQAYAQKRSDVQQANAQAAYQNQAAEGTYQDYLNGFNQQLAQKALDDQRLVDQRAYEEEQYQRQKEESKIQQRDSLYADLWQGVLDPNSNYTSEAIDDFAREYGLSEQQATSLKNLLSATKSAAQAKTEKEKSSALLASALDAIETSGSALSEQYLESLKQLGLSDADYETAKEAFQKQRYDFYSTQLREANAVGGMFDTGAVEESYKNGALTDEQYNNLKSAWNAAIDKSESLFFDGTDYIPKSAATQMLQNIIGNSWCSEETKKAVQSVYDKLYTPIQKGVSFNNNGGWWIFGATDYRDGDNFSIKDEGGTIYRIQSGGECLDENVYDIASDVKDGQVFGYNGKIYFKTGQKIYIVEKRDNSYGGDWEKLYKKFFG